MSLHRRAVLQAILFGTPLAGFAGPCWASESVRIRGQLCSLWASISGARIDVDSRTGDAILDRQLSLEAGRIADAFGVRPGLKIVLGPGEKSHNALATTDTFVDNTNGTVLLGRDLVFRELRENRRGWGGIAISGFLAHEFAHIYQFSTDYRSRLMKGSDTVKPTELHADFLAGYHLGLKRREGQAMDIGAFMDGIYFLGDKHVSDRNHHGTPDERRRAVREGYRTGIQRGKRPIEEIAEEGLNTVRTLL